MSQQPSLQDDDLERKKKKNEQKAKYKELKKQKAALKAEAAKSQAQQASKPSKKSERKNVKKGDEEDPAKFVDPETPPGQKKRLFAVMAKQYSPAAVEKSWYDWWEKSSYFVADSTSLAPPFTIVLPPPNVTGALHIGHALTSTIQDTIIRFWRMRGYNTLWVPGMDHAGIATQVVVEKKIMRERKLTRHDLGRENFVSEVWKWKDEYGGKILKQQRQLGASLDWSRECFTMDDKRSKAVTEWFLRLYSEGLIYRDLHLVNWDCVLRTAISDIEVDYLDLKGRTLLKVPGYENPVEFGVLTSFAYPLEGDHGEIVIATTRIETMLGDTAIAVHPEDARYKHLHNEVAIHPFSGRRIPIVCDPTLVDPVFGTGAVKITPAHDPNDFEVGKRHQLEFINIFADDGTINSNGGPEFAGMQRFEARVSVTKSLEEKGLYRGTKDNEMRLGICSRSNDVVEPLIKPQWYVNCQSMAKDALNAVLDSENRKIEILPKHYEAEWKRFETSDMIELLELICFLLGVTESDGLKILRDWCVSRQLWWGHRIPAWYVTLEDDKLKELGAYSDHWVVCRNLEAAQVEAQRKFNGKIFQITQDPDVLDSWFSAGIFPLSVLGWPDKTDDLTVFYPTSVLETGHDILFFWVARMVMLCTKLGGDVPFRKVYLHPMIRDAHGRKMSKSLGNVIDPLEVINGISLDGLHKRLEEGNLDLREVSKAKEGQKKDFPNGIPECGADALHFALISYTTQSDKINLDIQRVVGYRQWCNKLWNAIRFAMSKLGDNYVPHTKINHNGMPFSCQWILSALNKAVDRIVLSMEPYEFSDAATLVYSWWQFQLCDVFIEVIKPYFTSDGESFTSERDSARAVLWVCLDTGLRLLHPFMPFITEELWQRLPQARDTVMKESIMICEYPSVVQSWTNESVEHEMELIEAVVKSLRSLKPILPPKGRNKRRPAFALCRSDDVGQSIHRHQLEIITLVGLSSLKVLNESDGPPPPGCSIEVVNENISVYLEVQGTIYAEAELQKLKKKMDETKRHKETLEKMMAASGYNEKVPVKIQEENEAKLTKLRQEVWSLEEAGQHLITEIAS